MIGANFSLPGSMNQILPKSPKTVEKVIYFNAVFLINLKKEKEIKKTVE